MTPYHITLVDSRRLALRDDTVAVLSLLVAPQIDTREVFAIGRRLFEVLPSRVELAIVRVIDTPAATHIRYRVPR